MMPLRIGGMDGGAGAEPRDGAAGARRAWRPHASPARRAVGRRAAAHGGRARAGDDPAVLLADEPSGNLDHTNSERLHDLFAELARELEIGMVVVTHNRSLAARADRVLLLEDGDCVDTDVPGGRRLMVCDNCQERDAVVNLTTIENNAVRQLHLCEQCAAERGVETTVADAEASARRIPPGGAAADAGRRARTPARCASAARRCRTSARPAGWAARAATRRSSRACASCCAACTATRGTSGGAYRAAAATRCSSRRPCSASCASGCGARSSSEQFELAAELRDRIRVLE